MIKTVRVCDRCGREDILEGAHRSQATTTPLGIKEFCDKCDEDYMVVFLLSCDEAKKQSFTHWLEEGE